jgi:hypothetical protein
VSNGFIGNWTSGYAYCIVAKNLSMFCPCLVTLWEAEFKSNKLINLAEEISRYPSIQVVAWVLLAAFYQVYSEN